MAVLPKLIPVRPASTSTEAAGVQPTEQVKVGNKYAQLAQAHVSAIVSRLDGIRDGLESRQNEETNTLRVSGTYSAATSGRLSFGTVPVGVTWHVDMVSVAVTRGVVGDNGAVASAALFLDTIDADSLLLSYAPPGIGTVVTSTGLPNPDQPGGFLPGTTTNALGVPMVVPSGRELIVGYSLSGATITVPGRIAFALRRTIIREPPSLLQTA